MGLSFKQIILPPLNNYFNFIKGFLPNNSSDSSVGLDIGNSECKLVELSKSSGDFEIAAWAIESIKNNDITLSLKKIFERTEVPAKSCYTSIFGRGSLIRYVDMPQMSLEELKNAFSIEADKYFPFPSDQIYTDCYILETNAKSKQMSVMVAAAKRDIDRKSVV